jgi:hypothetical protein
VSSRFDAWESFCAPKCLLSCCHRSLPHLRMARELLCVLRRLGLGVCHTDLVTSQDYYTSKIETAELTINQKTQQLRRLEAQRNSLNARVRLLREELQLLQEPGSYVGEIVKVMSARKVLVKVQPEGKYGVCWRYHISLCLCYESSHGRLQLSTLRQRSNSLNSRRPCASPSVQTATRSTPSFPQRQTLSSRS